MKKHFQHEEHRRQDKVKRPYFTYVDRSPNQTWTGVDEQLMERIKRKVELQCEKSRLQAKEVRLEAEKVRRHNQLREAAIKKLNSVYFLYGKWLCIRGGTLWDVYKLNAAHAKPFDRALVDAYKQCRSHLELDFSKLASTIRQAPITTKQLSGGRIVERLEWRLSKRGLVADGVWWKIPKRLQQQLLDISDPKEPPAAVTATTNQQG